MTCLPQMHAVCRAARVQLTEFTPAVLRFQNGDCTTGNLEVISLTGGLVSLSKPTDRGSLVKLMFLSQNGPVLGTAEMLSPVSATRQPFHFLTLTYGDQRRLQAATMGLARVGRPPQTAECSQIIDREEEWIEKYRAATAQLGKPRRFVKLALAAGALMTLSVGYVIYLFSLHFQ